MADPIEKSDVSGARKWLDTLKVSDKAKVTALIHAKEGAAVLRQGGESIVVGGVLGAIAGNRAAGLDVGKVPIDGVVALAGLVGGVALAGTDFAAEARNAGATAAGVLAYRKTAEYFKAKKGGATSAAAKVHGEDFGAEDDIAKAAADL